MQAVTSFPAGVAGAQPLPPESSPGEEGLAQAGLRERGAGHSWSWKAKGGGPGPEHQGLGPQAAPGSLASPGPLLSPSWSFGIFVWTQSCQENRGPDELSLESGAHTRSVHYRVAGLVGRERDVVRAAVA